MKVPRERAIFVLRDSVIKNLEAGNKGSRFPTFHGYLDMEGEDIDTGTVKKLRAEFSQISDALGGLELGLFSDDAAFVPVESIVCKETLSPHAPLMARMIYQTDVDYAPRSVLAELTGYTIAMCDEAIRRNCGFGKYSKPS